MAPLSFPIYLTMLARTHFRFLSIAARFLPLCPQLSSHSESVATHRYRRSSGHPDASHIDFLPCTNGLFMASARSMATPGDAVELPGFQEAKQQFSTSSNTTLWHPTAGSSCTGRTREGPG